MNFYAVSGTNAIGVVTEYGEALAQKEGIVKFNTKKCGSYQEAIRYAADRFNQLYSGDKGICITNTHGFRLGKIYNERQINRISKRECKRGF